MPFNHCKRRRVNIAVCVFTAVLLVIGLMPLQKAYAEGAVTTLDTMETITFSEDQSLFANPESGWYRPYETDDIWSIDKLRSQGITMILLEANLKDFKTGPISDVKLNEIRNGFNLARKYGLQVMFRAAYDFDGVLKPEPTSLTVITGHIAQLKSIFYDNEDILYCVQAGFLGPWGEWHNSYYGDPPSLESRKAVINALMEAVPKSRSILVRRPMFIRDMYASTGSTLSLATAYSQSALARTGYHDDALLSSESECGTYVDSKYTRSAELNWTDNHDLYVPFVGESNKLSSYSDPNNAVYELNKLHAQSLNIDYHLDVISKWKSTNYGAMTTYNYVTQRLGYRFVMQDASISTSLIKGGALHLRFNIRNDGFANLVNARKLEVVLSNGQQTYTAQVNDDPRYWFNKNGVMTKDLYFSIPTNIGSGLWSIYLNLPSASSTLASNPLYSVRLANTGMWVQEKGYNLIKSGLTISSGAATGNVTGFEQITRETAQWLFDAVSGGVQAPAETPAETSAAPTATPASSTTSPAATVSASASPSPSMTAAPTALPTQEPTATSVETATATEAPVPTPTVQPSTGFESAVDGVTATAASYNSIRVSWKSLSGAEKYQVYRASTINGIYSSIATTTSLNYTNKYLTTGTTYYYKVRAYRTINGTKQYSPFSSVVYAASKPSKPAPVKVTKVSSTRSNVSWGAVAGATRYELWRANSSNGTYSLIAITGLTNNINSGLSSGRTYYYKVRAYRTVGSRKIYGSFSQVIAKRQ